LDNVLRARLRRRRGAGPAGAPRLGGGRRGRARGLGRRRVLDDDLRLSSPHVGGGGRLGLLRGLGDGVRVGRRRRSARGARGGGGRGPGGARGGRAGGGGNPTLDQRAEHAVAVGVRRGLECDRDAGVRRRRLRGRRGGACRLRRRRILDDELRLAARGPVARL